MTSLSSDAPETSVTSLSSDAPKTDFPKIDKISFTTFNFPEEIASVLAENNLVNPTPVQSEAIPHLMKGLDVLATAQTGTGKTLAFALPIVTQLMQNPESCALVLVPTRELAQQVLKTFYMLTKKTRGLKSVLLIGGAFMRAQCQDLAKGPRIIVGTPGRIIDHLSRRTLNPKGIRHVVLDEMDRMLDMGFGEQLGEIFSYLEGQRQTAMFSATLPGHITKLAQRYLTPNPVKISVGQHSQPVAKIKQEVLFMKQSEKQAKLLAILKERAEKATESADKGTVIIFVKTKIDCGNIADMLFDQGFKAAAMHGDLNQSRRQRVLQDFRSQKIEILVATDIASRGIDVAHIRLVINYELPQAAEDYIHRIGRTARGGAEGVSISFVASFETKKWVEILRLTSPEQAKAFQQKMGYQGGSGGSSSGRSFGGGQSSGRSFGGGQSSGRGFGGGGQSSGRGFGGDRSARPFNREDGDRSSRPAFQRDGDRPARPAFQRDGERPSFNRDRPDRSSSDRPARSFGQRDGDRPSFNRDRPDRSSSDRPARSFGQRDGDRPSFNRDRPDRSSDRSARPAGRWNDRQDSGHSEKRTERTPERSFSVRDGQIMGS